MMFHNRKILSEQERKAVSRSIKNAPARNGAYRQTTSRTCPGIGFVGSRVQPRLSNGRFRLPRPNQHAPATIEQRLVQLFAD